MAAVVVSLVAPTLGMLRLLIPVLIVGMPAFGALFTPAMALLSHGADRLQLDQGLAFSLGNLAWASGQAIAAAGSGALADATSDLVPYSAGGCVPNSLVPIRLRQRQTVQSRARAHPLP